MLKPTDLHKMWISVPSGLRAALRNDQHLICSHEVVVFVLAHIASGDTVEQHPAFATAASISARDPRPVRVLLVGDADLARFEYVEDAQQIAVYDTNGRIVGEIRMNGAEHGQLRTEHGRWPVTSALLSEIRAGDLFAISERTGPYRDWVVYAATSDFDNVVHARYTVWASRPELRFSGGNQVVYLLSAADKRHARLSAKVHEEV